MSSRVVSTFGACLVLSAALTGNVVADQAEDEQAIREIGDVYVAAFNAKDAEKLASYWSSEAVYTNRLTEEQVVGRDKIAEQFTQLFESQSDLQAAICSCRLQSNPQGCNLNLQAAV